MGRGAQNPRRVNPGELLPLCVPQPSPACDSTVTFPGVTFTPALQLGLRAVKTQPRLSVPRGKFTSGEKVGKDGAKGVTEVAPSSP